MVEARNRPIVKRRSVVFHQHEIQPERTAQFVGEKPSRLWSMFDGWTAEAETLDFLYSLVRLLKPRNAVETGTWLGRSAVAIGSSLRDNGFGSLASIEINPEAAKVASARVAEFQLEAFMSISVGPGLEFTPQGPYDFALFDSDIRSVPRNSSASTILCRPMPLLSFMILLSIMPVRPTISTI